MARTLFAVLVVATFLLPFVPLAAAEDPTTGNCERVNVPVNANIGLACALAGAGAGADCVESALPPVEASCTSVVSWSWLAYSSVNLPGEAVVTISYDVTTCLDVIGAEPVCEVHPASWTETCTWAAGQECRGEGRIDASWGPVTLDESGEQFKTLSHVVVSITSRSNAAGMPVGEASYTEFADWGDYTEALDCNGRCD